VLAYTADAGKSVWERKVSGGVVAGPISQEVGADPFERIGPQIIQRAADLRAELAAGLKSVAGAGAPREQSPG
jgi:hypothetical protein